MNWLTHSTIRICVEPLKRSCERCCRLRIARATPRRSIVPRQRIRPGARRTAPGGVMGRPRGAGPAGGRMLGDESLAPVMPEKYKPWETGGRGGGEGGGGKEGRGVGTGDESGSA